MTNPYTVPALPAAEPPHGGAVRAVLIGLIGAAGLFLLWMASGVLLMIFAALLIAVVFDAATVALCRVLPIGRAWSLLLVATSATLLVAGLLFWSGMSIAGQINDLVRALNDQLAAIAQKMTELGVTQETPSR
jgi:predicted PurR-regulated permease PerM